MFVMCEGQVKRRSRKEPLQPACINCRLEQGIAQLHMSREGQDGRRAAAIVGVWVV